MRYLYAFYAVPVIVLLLFNLKGDIAHVFAVGAWIVLWGLGMLHVMLRWRRYRWFPLVPLVPLAALLLIYLGQSIAFIVEHSGLDCGTCEGSPAAFLLFLAVDIALLIPGVGLGIWLVRKLRRR